MVAASETNVSVDSDNERVAATCATVTVAVAVSDPEVAVMVAVPSATEVTRPVEDTVATAASDVAHVTVALAILVFDRGG